MLTNDRIDSFYRNNLKKHGAGSKGVGWKDDFAQKIRFEQLVKVIDNNSTFTINDLGCGVGDLVSYLIERSLNFSFYYGYDILEEMVSKASQKYSDHTNCIFGKITSESDLKVADYSLASGIFNPRFGESDENWKKHIVSTLQTMNQKSVKGFSFNALTAYSDSELMRPELFYTDPLWLFDYCKRNFSSQVALFHDYGIYDFTILVRKLS